MAMLVVDGYFAAPSAVSARTRSAVILPLREISGPLSFAVNGECARTDPIHAIMAVDVYPNIDAARDIQTALTRAFRLETESGAMWCTSWRPDCDGNWNTMASIRWLSQL